MPFHSLLQDNIVHTCTCTLTKKGSIVAQYQIQTLTFPSLAIIIVELKIFMNPIGSLGEALDWVKPSNWAIKSWVENPRFDRCSGYFLTFDKWH